MGQRKSGELVFDTRSLEFEDTPELEDRPAPRFTHADVIVVGFKPYPSADHYGVGYGELCAMATNGRQLAVLDAATGNWE